jgi:hypothetical protein
MYCLILLSYFKQVLEEICVTKYLLLVKSMIPSHIRNLFSGWKGYILLLKIC